jgi:hypothetical protein
VQTVGLETGVFLTEHDGELVSLEEAKRRLPGVSWPDTQHALVRYFGGSVRVANAKVLLAPTGGRKHGGDSALAIKGDLVVDGHLACSAEGDGVLVVEGSVWAQAASFIGCITLVCRALEVASVILCAYGDDGGALWVDEVRAQVFHYSTYFSKPECPIDAFCIGDTYGDRSFPPDRGGEVFVAEVLADGALDERLALDWLRRGEAILLPE